MMNELESGAETGPGMNIDAKIRELAYQKWVEAGRPSGDGIHFWLEAEQEVWEREAGFPGP